MSRNGAAVVSAFRLLLRPSGVSRHRGLRLAPVTAFALHLRPCGGHELQQHRTFAATTSDDDGKHPLDKHKTQLETGGLEVNHTKGEVKVQEDVKSYEEESKKSDENELEDSESKGVDKESLEKAVIAESSRNLDRKIQENPLQVIKDSPRKALSEIFVVLVECCMSMGHHSLCSILFL
ncbi:Hypothetical predicted protein [Drosophila guanche]|uniref:Uncharacterized protein n=1 Tax=Drosophila guanche TaxID=7266 RepID=A0A3B0JST7_DROGU|nr:Hypothetical predicted protein [Drosophila guanche]